jgi:hypothetical protein
MCKRCGEQVTRYNRVNKNIQWKWWTTLGDHLANLFVVPFCLGSICMIYVVHCCTFGGEGGGGAVHNVCLPRNKFVVLKFNKSSSRESKVFACLYHLQVVFNVICYHGFGGQNGLSFGICGVVCSSGHTRRSW